MKPWHELTSLPVQQVNRKARGKYCADCSNYVPSPGVHCKWGICRAEIERWDGGSLGGAWVSWNDKADECENYEEE
jgi:hypothetical protein